jgi:hypothetical protein
VSAEFVQVVLDFARGEGMTLTRLDDESLDVISVTLRADRFASGSIKTREQLASAPYETVVRDSQGLVYEQQQDSPHEESVWMQAGSEIGWGDRDLSLPVTVLFRPDGGERPSGAGDPVLPRGEILTEQPSGDSIISVREGVRFTRIHTETVDGWIEVPTDPNMPRAVASWDQLLKFEPRLISTPTTDAEEAAR